ncbi:MAG: hypothetical protein HGB01_11660 [Chlorobiaceae bacterium]|nr:hypothetical protein [Chlorobiaceae bacterium]
MSHVRQQIRKRVVSRLLGNLTALVGSRVYASRVLPLTSEVMPAVCVYTPGEKPGSDETLSGCMRALDLFCDIYVAGEDPDELMDQISSGIEKALYSDQERGRYLGGLAMGIKAPPAMATTLQGEGESLHGIMRLMFKVLYQTQDGDPEHAG